MQTEIQRQYDEVIASRYDFDPQGLIGSSLRRVIDQLAGRLGCGPDDPPLNVLDLGTGTGLFLEKLREQTGLRFQPYGLDISQRMIEIAQARIPELIAAVDDAANLDRHFRDIAFDLVGTHFITGFVPVDVLAPKVYDKLRAGGVWTVMGARRDSFSELQRRANAPPCRWVFGPIDVGRQTCVPVDHDEVARTLQQHGFTIRVSETFRPPVRFRDFDEFLEFAYYGGWLTPFIEAVGLQNAGRFVRFCFNTFFFPVQDHHSIFLVVAEKS